MARIRKDEPLKASLLDRLIKGRSQGRTVLSDLMENVRRDLEDLLNTRRYCAVVPPELRELRYSLVHYGLRDFSGSSLGSPEEQERFRRDIEDVIRRYEPRLSTIVVKAFRAGDTADRTMRFRIEAVLKVGSAPVPVVFDSALKLLSASFEIEGGSE